MHPDDENFRQAASLAAMVGLLAANTPRSADDVARAAVEHADALIRALDA